MKTQVECIHCDHKFKVKFEDGKKGKCPKCMKKYVIGYHEDDDQCLQVFWPTGININDL